MKYLLQSKWSFFYLFFFPYLLKILIKSFSHNVNEGLAEERTSGMLSIHNWFPCSRAASWSWASEGLLPSFLSPAGASAAPRSLLPYGHCVETELHSPLCYFSQVVGLEKECGNV